jgi:hypothetical protein
MVHVHWVHMDSTDRALLEQVSRATFANPFGQERWALDAEIASTAPDADDVVDRAVARVAEVRERVGPLDEQEAGERTLVEHALLFDAFHRFAEDFDAFIERQRRSEEPVPFEQHRSIARFLAAGGFPRGRIGRVFELFYQLRRAFLFIRDSLVGESGSMRGLRASLWNQLFTQDVRRYEAHLWDRMEDFSLILTGETGTGKGAAAAALGAAGFIGWDSKAGAFEESFGRTFVPLNLSEVPGTLLESALFGHEKGAFTGAIRKSEGALARCPAHGMIFLDEIGEIGPATQVKLLRVLQERTYTPLGATRPERFRGRVVAATHQSLSQLREEGRFRDDFYYRLCSDVVEVPPLRVRLREEPTELDALLSALTTRIVGSAELAPMVREAIDRDLPADYRWPGNVRELEQTVRRVLITGRCGEPEDRPSGDGFARAQEGELTARELLDAYCAHLYEVHGTYEAVARITDLDRRTVKKHVVAAG